MIADRRTILTGAAVALAAAPALAMAQGRHRMDRDPASMPMPDVSGTRTHQQFQMGVIGPAQLSLVTSQIAVDRARKADAREFAGFELAEAIAVTTVLKQLGTSVPPMDAKAQATLEKIRSAPAGQAFDRATSTRSTRTTCSCAISRPPTCRTLRPTPRTWGRCTGVILQPWRWRRSRSTP